MDHNVITVLIVDDHPVLRSGLKISLRDLESVKVIGEAGDGKSAIRETLRLQPDVVLMDVAMPEMDGIEASWRIKQESPHTRIIMFTSCEDTKDITAALGAGADGYCMKHSPTKRIGSAMASVMRGECWLDPELVERMASSRSQLVDTANDQNVLSPVEQGIIHLIEEGKELSEIAQKLQMETQEVSSLMRAIIRRFSEKGTHSVEPSTNQSAGRVSNQEDCAPITNNSGDSHRFTHDWYSATASNTAGLVLADKYLLETVLGAGGIGVVFKARHLYMDRVVAIKFLRPEFREDGRVARAFQQEAKALANLKHKNIVDVYDFGVSTSKQPYLVMEFMEGVDLETILSQQPNNKLSLERFISLFEQACEALNTAHSKNIVHCDLKPSNILVLPEKDGQHEEVKIVDFGLAKTVPKELTTQSQLTDSYVVDGTPAYMPPEQCSGKNIDNRSDIYALGSVMYECLAGLNPFRAEAAIQIFAKQFEFVPPPVSSFAHELAPYTELDICIAKMLEKDPARRQQSIKEVAEVLHKLRPMLVG